MKPKVLLISILYALCAGAQESQPLPGMIPPQLPLLRAGPGLTIFQDYPSISGMDVPLSSRVFMTSTARLSFDRLAAHTCRELPMPAAFGGAVGDAVISHWPNTLNAGLVGVIFVSAPDVVTVRLCNTSAITVAPTPWLIFSATIIKTF